MLFTPYIIIQDGGAMVLHFQGRSLQCPQNRNGFQNPSGCDSDIQCLSQDFNVFSSVHTVIMTELPQYYDDKNTVDSRISNPWLSDTAIEHSTHSFVPVVTLLTYLLTPWRRVLLEKLTDSAASQEILHIYGT
jgi:hypothetical protein